MTMVRVIAVTLLTSLGSVVPAWAQCPVVFANVTIGGHALRDRSFYPNSAAWALPIAGLEMEIQWATGGGGRNATVTDQDGMYAFDGLCPGVEYLVQPAHDQETMTLQVPNDDIFNWRAVSLQVPMFGRGVANFTLEPLTEEITIRVVHPANLGIPDVSVVVVPEGRNRPEPTDANGESVIRGLPCCSRRYLVALTKPDLSIDRSSRTFTLERGQPVSASFRGVPIVVVPDLAARSLVQTDTRLDGYIPHYTFLEASLELLRLGLPAERQRLANVIPELNDRVADQSPEAGARRTQGTRVSLTVYDSTRERVPRVVGEPWRTAARILGRRPGRFRPILGRPRGFYISAAGNDITSIRHNFRDVNGDDINRCHITQLGLVEQQAPDFAEEPIPGIDATRRTNENLPGGADVTLEVCVPYRCHRLVEDGRGEEIPLCTPVLDLLGLPPVGDELPQ